MAKKPMDSRRPGGDGSPHAKKGGDWRKQSLPSTGKASRAAGYGEAPAAGAKGRRTKAKPDEAASAEAAPGAPTAPASGAAARKSRHPQADRDERRRQGSLQAASRLTGNSVEQAGELPEAALLHLPARPGLEQRVHAWLDVLVYVWRRRKIGARARFIRNAYLKEEEVAVLGPAIQQLSRGFTGHRNLVGKTYLDDPDLLGAYLLFYWPVSYAQAWTVLGDIERRHGLPALRRVADLGCGPGPLACALLDKAVEQQATAPLEILALDHSPEALKLLEELVRAAHGPDHAARCRLETKAWDAAKPLPGGACDIVAAGHVLNELWNELQPAQAEAKRAGLLQATAGKLRPAEAGAPRSFLMVLEPALKPTTRGLIAVRDRLAGAGLPILGPCLFQGACPVLATAEGTCHGQVFWEIPGLIRQLAKTAHLSKDELAMAWLAAHAVSRGETTVAQGGEGLPPQPADIWRVTSEPMLNKAGRTRYMVCGATGRTALSLKQGELLAAAAEGKPRNRAQAVESAFFALRRGDAIRLTGATERESGFGVGADTRIDLL
jgi:SAM-dependent methyltransferase